MSPRATLTFFCSMAVLTLAAAALWAFRWYRADIMEYRFLLWNLYLAWIPFGFALLAADKLKKGSSTGTLLYGWAAFAVWLVFFPNAPYILTDLAHFRYIDTVSWWYDLAMILTFAGCGLMLGLGSLRIMHTTITKLYSERAGWWFAMGASFVCAFGIYLGRFQRYNTWDILTNPFDIAIDIAARLIFPWEHVRTWGMTATFGLLIAMIYIAIHAMGQQDRTAEPATESLPA